MDAKAELTRKVQNVARSLHFELVLQGHVEESTLLPRDEITVEETADGVLVHFFAPSAPKKRLVRRTYDAASDEDAE